MVLTSKTSVAILDDAEDSTDISSVGSFGEHKDDQLIHGLQLHQTAIVVVDPWSSGVQLCKSICERKVQLIVVWPNVDTIRHKELSAIAMEVIVHSDTDEPEIMTKRLQALEATRNVEIIGVIPGSETGVLLAEKLAHLLDAPQRNSLELSLARRDKYLMGETIRNKGVRAVKQATATSLNEAIHFLEDLWGRNQVQQLKAVMKPVASAGSDCVFLCQDFEDAEKYFSKIHGSTNSLGIRNEKVLLQEFLQGPEYVLDTVSYKGIHKVVQIWKYDKRKANGQFNVYFGMRPVAAATEEVHKLIEYFFQVLDALQISNGMAHGEVILTPTGPCLVEVGSRCHGGNSCWMDIATQVYGQNHISVALDTFTQIEQFLTLPKYPLDLKRYGAVVDLVSFEEGRIAQIPGAEIVKGLSSFHRMHLCVAAGSKVVKTVDCNTTPGHIELIHEDCQQVEKDFNTIHSLLEQKKFFMMTQ